MSDKPDKKIVGENVETDLEVEDFPQEEELEDTEATAGDKIRDLRQKLKESERERLLCLEDLQRAKADFLNTRKRLIEGQSLDRDRQVVNFLEKLFPLCDSFSLAMSDKVTWEVVDKNWRTGVEGIFSQLQNILSDYGVLSFNPLNEAFDPKRHEALSTIPVTSASENNKVVSVIQIGYERVSGGKPELIRPAKVVVGEFKGNE